MDIKLEGNNVLAIEVRHQKDDKTYVLYVMPTEIKKLGNGMVCRKTKPRQDGGFKYTVESMVRRKSQKKLDHYNAIVYEYSEEIKDWFLSGDYQSIVNLF